MPAETIIAELESKIDAMAQTYTEIGELVTALKDAGKEEWDWISVKKASELLDVSVNAIYAKINSGKLTTRHVGAKTFVKQSEVMAIND